MNDVLSRAAALNKLIQSSGQAPARPLIEALASCCNDLLDAGEHQAALALIDSSKGISEINDQDWKLRIGLIHVRALTLAGELLGALALVSSLRSTHREALDNNHEVGMTLRILEGPVLWSLNRSEEAIEKLLVVRDELLRRPDSNLLANCTLHLSSAYLTKGDYVPAKRFALEAIVSARRTGAPRIESSALFNMGILERALCHWSSALEASEAALEISRMRRSPIHEMYSLRGCALVALKRGGLPKALELSTSIGQLAALIDNAREQRLADLLHGMILLHMGSFARAWEILKPNAPWGISDGRTRHSLLTTEFLGDVHLEQGQAEQALRFYEEVWPKALALVPKGDIVAELRRRRAECHLLLGHVEEAYEEAKTGLEHCRELGDRYEEAATYRVLALSAAARGNAAEAKQWFDQGFAYYDDIETPYEWGKLWLAYGDWLRGPHAAEFADARGALEAYQAARDHFERMGAEARLAEAKQRLDEMVAMLAPPAAPDDAAAKPRPRRRPLVSTELERRSEWARETFGLVTRNRHLLNLLDDVRKLAASETPVLVLGESGTGKELIAQGLHKLSGRSGGFVPINCGAFPREMIESELFGHMAGAFTGAVREKPGLFEVCDHGTVFLDEIGEMSLDLQSRLLRFLETGESRRVGSNRNISVDTRIVAATNRERAVIERGENFRPDLYYRLAHAVVTLPPLRRRGDDVDLLVDYFLEESCAEEGKRVRLSAGARRRLGGHPWPGNIRQLRSVVRRVVILAVDEREVMESDLQLEDDRVPTTLLEELEGAEKKRIVEALEHARGSRSDAARALGMPRTTLINKLRRFGIA